MQLHWIFAISLLFSFQFSLATDLASKGKPAKKYRGLLWKISGNGLEKPSYLFGTIHMICPEDWVWDKTIEKAFSETEQLVMELDMDDPALPQQMQKHSINSGMDNISDEFSEEELALLDGFLKSKYGAGMQQLGIMKPFVLMSMLLPKYAACQTPQAYESNFVALAQKAKKEVFGLETVAYQMGIFDEMPFEDQIEMVTQTLMDSATMQKQLTSMTAAYRAQDLDQLFAVISESPEYEDFLDVLLTDRNKLWIPKIKEMIAEKPSFVAVGAGHLASEKGVIELLREEGYRVEPVLFE